MLLNQERGFGYVHIPKCAGSTIRTQLREYDDLGGKFFRMINHPILGRINGNHLPLYILDSYYPEEFKLLKSVRSYTICRNPMERFISGMSQLFRSEFKTEPAELSSDKIHAESAKVIQYLENLSGMPDYKYVYFTPQYDYVYLEEEKIVNVVVPVKDIDIIFDALESFHGLNLVRDSIWNPTVTYRFPAMTSSLNKLKDISKNLFPVEIYARIRDMGILLFTAKGSPNVNEVIVGSQTITNFIKDFYKMDYWLYEMATNDTIVADRYGRESSVPKSS